MPRKTKEASEDLVKAVASDTVKSTTRAKKSDSTKTVSKKASTKKANSKDSASKEASIKSKLEKTTKSKSGTIGTTKKSTELKKAVTKSLSSNETDNTKKSASTKSTTKKSIASKKNTDFDDKSKVKNSTSTKSTKNTTTKKDSTKTISSDETANAKKATSSKSTDKKNVESKTKSTSAKKSSTKSSSITKATATKSNSKTTSAKKKNNKTSENNLVSVLEYYDLPYRYNETVVKILAQTPNILFVYWDISDVDRNNFKLYYGDNFFEVTRPVLIVHNETMNYSFELEINDFANSWYLHVNDANCKYNLELGRRPLQYISNIQEPYIYVSSSNKLDAPNNHILFEKFNPSVTYKNVKNNSTFKKDFSNMVSFANMQKIYGIYDLYKQIYKDELFNEITNSEIANPSSGSSSSFK